MKSVFILILFFFVCNSFTQTTNSSSSGNTIQQKKQETTPNSPPPEKNIMDKIYYGGYINLSLGKYMVFGLEPMIAYKMTPKLSTGVKLRYDYIRDNRYSSVYTTSNYGGSVFGRYRIIPPVYAHVEYAYYNYDLIRVNDISKRIWVPFLFVGAGFSHNMGRNTWLTAQVLFDVLQNSNSPYSDWEPFYSFGIGFGF